MQLLTLNVFIIMNKVNLKKKVYELNKVSKYVDISRAVFRFYKHRSTSISRAITPFTWLRLLISMGMVQTFKINSEGSYLSFWFTKSLIEIFDI